MGAEVGAEAGAGTWAGAGAAHTGAVEEAESEEEVDLGRGGSASGAEGRAEAEAEAEVIPGGLTSYLQGAQCHVVLAAPHSLYLAVKVWLSYGQRGSSRQPGPSCSGSAPPPYN